MELHGNIEELISLEKWVVKHLTNADLVHPLATVILVAEPAVYMVVLTMHEELDTLRMLPRVGLN